MLNQQDLKQIAAHGITEAQVERQLSQFKTGFPFLRLEGPAAIGAGIMAPESAERDAYIKAW
ncbi:DUF4301 family protein, partial [Segatella buccae]